MAASKDYRAKAQKLVKLAVENASEQESCAAALAACKLIDKHDLLATEKRAAKAAPVAEWARAKAAKYASSPKVHEAVEEVASAILRDILISRR